MDTSAEKYINEVEKRLSYMPVEDKNDIICEIRNHIYEAVNRQENINDVLNKLGSPKKLAKSYSHSYAIETEGLKISDIINNFTFYISTGLSGIIIIPFLSILSFALVLTTIILIIVSISNFIGITDVPFTFINKRITGIGQIIITFIFSGIFMFIANACWNGLKKYIGFISTNYHKRKLRA